MTLEEIREILGIDAIAIARMRGPSFCLNRSKQAEKASRSSDLVLHRTETELKRRAKAWEELGILLAREDERNLEP